jgi:hypothetical protein
MIEHSSDERLSRLADRFEIADVLSANAHGVDRQDGQLVLSCYHPDATFTFLDQPPVPVTEFLSGSSSMAVALRLTGHHLSNHLVSFDGDQADSQIYLSAYHLVAADAPPAPVFSGRGKEYGVLIGGRYIDRFERRDKGWRILRRTLTFDWSFDVDGPSIPEAMLAVREGGMGAKLGWLRG